MADTKQQPIPVVNTDDPNSLVENKGLVSISQAAKILGVSIDTVRRWDKSGTLHSTRPDGKNRYFSVDELESVKFGQPLTISEVSEQLGVSASTLRRLEEKGLIKPERNQNGERMYDKKSLENFLRSEYFIRQKDVEEEILKPLNGGEANEGKKDNGQKTGVRHDPTTHALLGEHHVDLAGLKLFRSRVIASLAVLAGAFVTLIVILTLLFMLFPEGSGRMLGYTRKGVTGKQFASQESAGWIARQLKPFSETALRVVEAVNPDLRNKIAPAPVIKDVNQVFQPDEDGNVQSLFTFTVPDTSYLKIPDQGLIVNLNADMVRGRVPGDKEGDLAVLPIQTGHIKDGSITREKLSPGVIALLGAGRGSDTYVVNGTTTGGSQQDIVAGAGLNGGGNGAVVNINVGAGDGIITSADLITLDVATTGGSTATQSNSGLELSADGLRMLGGCSSGQILKWNGSVWTCSADSGAGGGSIRVEESDGTPNVDPTSILQFSTNGFTVSNMGSNTALVGLSSSVLTNTNYTTALDPSYINYTETPTAGDISGSFQAGFAITADSVALGTDTTGNYIATLSGSGGLTVTGSGSETAGVSLALDVSTAGTTGNIASNSGLEVAADGLRLLGGCSTNQVLKWTGTNWLCSSDNSDVPIDVYEGGNLTTSGVSAFDFNGSDFAVSNVVSQANVAIDYTNSGITRRTQNEVITGGWTFNDSGMTLQDNADNTKRARFELSGITTGTTRIFTAPNVNGMLITDGNLTDIDQVGTVTSGTWEGSTIGTAYGGTGLNTSAAANGSLLIGNGSGFALANLTQGSGVTITNGAGSITIAADLGTSVSTAEIENDAVTLGTLTNGNYVATITGSTGLTVSGSGSESASVSLALDVTTTGTTATTNSNSGLEVGANGLRLIGGCANTEILKWNGSAWACATDANAGSLGVQENDASVTAAATILDFLGADFDITESPAGEANIAIDFLNSGITRRSSNETITGNWTFNDSGMTLQDNADSTKRARFELANVTAGTTRIFDVPDVSGTLITSGNLADINAVGTVASGTWQGSVISTTYGGTGVNASSATNGQLLIGDGAGFDLATLTQGAGVTITNGAGSITIAADLGTSISSSEIDNDAVALGTKTTGNYVATVSGGTGLNVTGSGSENAGVSIALDVNTTGTTLTTVSNSGLEVGADGLRLVGGCANTEILKWNGSAWACAADANAGSLGVQENDTTVTGAATVLDFLGAEFNVTETPAGEANVAIDYTNSGITRRSSNETIAGTWTFNDSGMLLQDNADATKRARFELAGVTAGTTRVLDVPDVSGTLITSGNLADINAVGTIASGTWQGSVISTTYGGTGVNASSATNGQLLIGNGSGFSLASLTQGTGVTITNGAGSITVAADLGTSISNSEIENDAVTLGTQTTGNYVATVSGGNGIGASGSGSENAGVSLNLAALTTDWDQSGAFDINLNNANSELRILESAGGIFYGALDVGDLSANAIYTFSGASGTVLTTSNYSGTTDSIYVNVGESPAAGDISGSFSGGLTINNSAVTNAKLQNSGISVSLGTNLSGSSSVSLGGTLTVNMSATPSFTSVSATTFTGALAGNATTATALQSNPDDCAANEFAVAIAANGNLTCAVITDADVPDALTIGAGSTVVDSALSANVTLLGATITKDELTNSGTLGFTWSDAEVANVLTIGAGSSVVDSALSSNVTLLGATITKNELTNSGTLGFTWSDSEISDTLTIGAGSTVADGALSSNVTKLGATITKDELTGTGVLGFTWSDSEISDTLTASIFKGSGSTTDAIDLATAEVAGSLGDGNISDTLTISAGSTVADGALSSNVTKLGATITKDELTGTGVLGFTWSDAEVADVLTVGTGSTVVDGALSANVTLLGATITKDELTNTGTLGFTWSDSEVANNITIDLATAAVALQNNPTDCAANQFAHTIAANGNLTCAALTDADIPNNITIDLATAAVALQNNPTDCTTDQYAHTIAANGNLTCSAITEAQVSGVITDVTAGNGLTGTAASGNATLSIGAGNGITVNADDITIDATTTGTTVVTNNNSGLEVTSTGLRLLGGCSGNQVLRWNNTTSVWQCSSTDLDTVYLVDADKTFTINNTAGLNVDLTTTGDFVIKDGGVAFATFDDAGGIQLSPAATSDITFALDNDSNFFLTALITDAGSAQNINVTLGDNAGNDAVNGLSITATSASTGDADQLVGLRIESLNNAAATVAEYAISIGANWDRIINSANYWVTGDGDVIAKGPVVDARAFGADCDGAGDDSAAIQAALDSVASSGGTVRLPSGNCIIDNTLVMNDSSVSLTGNGAYGVADTGVSTKGTTLVAAADPVVQVIPQGGVGGTDAAIKRVAITNMNIDCIGSVNIGLSIMSVHSSTFKDLYIRNCNTVGIDMNVVNYLEEARDNTKNMFENISIRTLESTGGLGMGMRLDGDLTGNTSLTTFNNINIQHSNGIGVKLLNSDSNRFIGLVLNRTSGSAIGVEFNGSNTSAAMVARANVFWHFEPGQGGTVARGTTSFTNPSANNKAYDYTLENNNILPIIEAGATFNYDSDRYFTSYVTAPNFGGLMQVGAFISTNSYVGQEFAADVADIVANDGPNWGDDQGWVVDTQAAVTNTCTFSILNDTVNGIHQQQNTGANTTCNTYLGLAAADMHTTYTATNLPVIMGKVKPSNVGAADDFWVGLQNQTQTVANAEPDVGIFFTNDNGTTWTGVVKTAAAVRTTVVCTGHTVSTTAFAQFKIEVASTTDVRFYIDTDVSNGVNFTYCGSATTNVPTALLAPMLKHSSTTANRNLQVDFWRGWQDDSAAITGLAVDGESPESTDANADGLEFAAEDSAATDDQADMAVATESVSTSVNVIGIDLETQLAQGGEMVIKDAAGIEVAKVDDKGNMDLQGGVTASGLALKGADGAENVNIGGDGNASFSGVLSAKDIKAQQIVTNDIGEKHYTDDDSINPGDVVAFDVSNVGKLKKSDTPYGRTVMGVVTGSPNLLIDREGDGRAIYVALAGTVSVKVSNENGAIQPGDPLTSSSVPGVAMKATKAGPIIGRAVMGYSGAGIGSVLVSVDSGFSTDSFADSIANLENRLDTLEDKVLDSSASSSGVQNGDGQDIDLSNLSVGNMTVNLDLVVKGALVVEGEATFQAAVRFEKEVEFSGRTTFNDDTAGFAKVVPGKRKVSVSFDKPYETAPVISLTLGNGKFASYSYENVSANGFDIVLDQPANEELTFSWIALAVRNAEIHVDAQ